ncbi:(2Fe-2S)-binding protein [Neobacillus niacini]|uniref:(2Fe-2S)-binding protein n=1 Tax=Neobacillus niacini TaxID=86668 RepID=UPI002FFF78DD
MSQSNLRNITFSVNGKGYNVQVEPRMLLSDVLRDELRLTGTHVGCEHGICGACTVIMDGRPIRSCLAFGVQADKAEIKTVEGLAENSCDFHPLQQAFWEKHGLQCGFCTSGMLMTAYDFLEKNHNPTREQIREGISGNLCRCTGYQNIVEAVELAAEIINKKKESLEGPADKRMVFPSAEVEV